MNDRLLAMIFTRHFWMAMAFLIFAAGLGLTGALRGGTASDLARDGVETTATVTARNTWTVRGNTGGSGTRHWTLSVEFDDTAMRPVILTLPVSQALYERTSLGDTLTLRHMPDDPHTAELEPGSIAEDAGGFRGIALVMALAGLFFLIRAAIATRARPSP